jgi:hypothetical protein
MASRKRVAELAETITDAELHQAEAPGDGLICTTAEMIDLMRMEDPEQRRRREAEIRNRPPSPPEPEPTIVDVLERLQGLRSEIEDHHLQLLDNVLDSKEQVLELQQEVRALRELVERAVDGG